MADVKSEVISDAVDRAVQVIDACWYAEAIRLRDKLLKRLDAARAAEGDGHV